MTRHHPILPIIHVQSRRRCSSHLLLFFTRSLVLCAQLFFIAQIVIKDTSGYNQGGNGEVTNTK